MHKYSKEDIDLGGEVRRVLRLNPNVSELSLGSNFKDYLYELGFEDIRSVTKKLLSPIGINEILHLFSWAIKQGFVNVITDAIPVIFGKASCTIKLISNIDNPDSQQPKLPFYIEDATGYFKSFIVIDRLVSFADRDGRTLLHIVKSIDIPCIIQVGYLFSGDYDYAKETNYWSYLDNLVLKYEQYGFVNVNSIIGCYEDSVIMAYAKGLKSVEDYKKVIEPSFNSREYLKDYLDVLPKASVDECNSREDCDALLERLGIVSVTKKYIGAYGACSYDSRYVEENSTFLESKSGKTSLWQKGEKYSAVKGTYDMANMHYGSCDLTEQFSPESLIHSGLNLNDLEWNNIKNYSRRDLLLLASYLDNTPISDIIYNNVLSGVEYILERKEVFNIFCDKGVSINSLDCAIENITYQLRKEHMENTKTFTIGDMRNYVTEHKDEINSVISEITGMECNQDVTIDDINVLISLIWFKRDFIEALRKEENIS